MFRDLNVHATMLESTIRIAAFAHLRAKNGNDFITILGKLLSN